MTAAKIALLEDRGVVAVTGEDAEKFLQGLITNDLEATESGGAVFAALLSPQGKILFDFFVMKVDGGYLIDVAKDQAAALTKRLGIYKLRARVNVADQSGQVAVVAGLVSDIGGRAISFLDPRHAHLWPRCILLDAAGFGGAAGIAANRGWGTQKDYHAQRISLGIPEGGKDYAWGEVAPHEANMDMLHGVSFTKGCYVGQEIVARMEHRGTARRRIVRVHASNALPPAGTEVKAGDVVIGAIGSSLGTAGLAMLRLDRVAEFEALGTPLTAGGVPLRANSEDVARLVPRQQQTPT